jgi:uncharacterized membrane protein
MFTVTDLGTLGESDSFATALNDQGQVLGRVRIPDKEGGLNLNQRAVLWDGGEVVDLGTNFAGKCLNSRGQIAGSSIPDDWDPFTLSGVTGSRPAFYDGQRVQELFDGSAAGLATAINGDGQIVGTVRYSHDVGQPLKFETHAFLWTRGEALYLSVPPEYVQGVPEDINDHGDAVGYLQTRSTDGVQLSNLAALWRQGEVTALGTLPDADQSKAVAINNKGTVLCRAFFGVNEFQRQLYQAMSGGETPPTGRGFSQCGFLWQDGRLQSLSVAAAASLRPVDVNRGNKPCALNDQDQVVGGAYDVSDGNIAFVWRDGVMENLNDLIPADSGWVLTEAAGVNNHGQIVGNGKHDGLKRAFLLSPVSL